MKGKTLKWTAGDGSPKRQALAMAGGILLAFSFLAGPAGAIDGDETPGPSLPASAFPQPAFPSRLTIIHFWATWCVPCKKEIPELVRFYHGPFAQLSAQNMAIATVSNDLRGTDLTRYLATQEFPLPLYFDPYSRISAVYDVSALPATLVLSRDGTVLKRWLGVVAWNDPAIAAELAALTKSSEVAP